MYTSFFLYNFASNHNSIILIILSMRKKLLLFALAAFSAATALADSFVTTSGTKILDRNGKEITLQIGRASCRERV